MARLPSRIACSIFRRRSGDWPSQRICFIGQPETVQTNCCSLGWLRLLLDGLEHAVRHLGAVLVDHFAGHRACSRCRNGSCRR